uniref:Uncharacterized protein n=2 Tax=Parascaris univalens TaxID=6257 RepID=A0A914ZNG7_PARUN
MGCTFSRHNAKGAIAQPMIKSTNALISSKSSKISDNANSSNTVPIIEDIDRRQNESLKIEATQRSVENSSEQNNANNEEMQKIVDNHCSHRSENDERQSNRKGEIKLPQINEKRNDKANIPSKETQNANIDGKEDSKQKEGVAKNEEHSHEMRQKREKRHHRTIERRTRPLVFDPEDDTLFEIPLKMPEVDLSAGIQATN